ncbi:MAG TPA: VOC family protein [Acidimicrobiales bacterium]|nr:VOC family protein [Acidimicrobiales bacterium]
MADNAPPPLNGIHHVRLPVSDVVTSCDWYGLLGFEPVLDYEEEDQLVGVALRHPSGITLGLHLAPDRASALAGFCPLALEVDGQAALEDWLEHLDRQGLQHSPVQEGHLGLFAEVADPDGLVVQLHTADHPSADEA